MLGPDDPRRVGGRYRSGYWPRVHRRGVFRSSTIGAVSRSPCAGKSPARWHPPPCVHVHTATHNTAWHARVDRELFEPLV